MGLVSVCLHREGGLRDRGCLLAGPEDAAVHVERGARDAANGSLS